MIDKERLTTILDSTHKRDKTEKLEAFSKILDPKLWIENLQKKN